MNLVQDLWNTVAWLLSERELRSLALSNKALYNSLANHTIWTIFIAMLNESTHLELETREMNSYCARDGETTVTRWMGRSPMAYYGEGRRFESQVIVEPVKPTRQDPGNKYTGKVIQIDWPQRSGQRRIAVVEACTVQRFGRGSWKTYLLAHDCYTGERIDTSLTREVSLEIVKPAYRKYNLIWYTSPSGYSEKPYPDLILYLQDEFFEEFEYETTLASELQVFNGANLPLEEKYNCDYRAVFVLYHAKMPMRLDRFEKCSTDEYRQCMNAYDRVVSSSDEMLHENKAPLPTRSREEAPTTESSTTTCSTVPVCALPMPIAIAETECASGSSAIERETGSKEESICFVQDLWHTVAWLLSERELRSLALTNKALYNSLANHTRWETLINELIEPRRIETSNTHCLCVRESDVATSRWRGKSLLDYCNSQRRIESQISVKTTSPVRDSENSLLCKKVLIEWPANSGERRLGTVKEIWRGVASKHSKSTIGQMTVLDCLTSERINVMLRPFAVDVVRPAYRKYKLIRHSLSLLSSNVACPSGFTEESYQVLAMTLQDEDLSEFDYETRLERELEVYSSFCANLPLTEDSDKPFSYAVFILYQAKMPMRLERFEMLKSGNSAASKPEVTDSVTERAIGCGSQPASPLGESTTAATTTGQLRDTELNGATTASLEATTMASLPSARPESDGDCESALRATIESTYAAIDDAVTAVALATEIDSIETDSRSASPLSGATAIEPLPPECTLKDWEPPDESMCSTIVLKKSSSNAIRTHSLSRTLLRN